MRERMRKYERVAWRYKNVYRKLHANSELNEFEHSEIERLQKQVQSHRNTSKEFKQLEAGAFVERGFFL